MSTRRQGQRRVNSTPITATINRELLESLEDLVASRRFSSRSDAINKAVGFLLWTLENEPERFYGSRVMPVNNSQQPQQPSQPQPDTDPYYPR